MRLHIGSVSLALLVAASAITAAQTAARSEARVHRSVTARVPLYLVENRGVLPDEVRFHLHGAGKTVYFTDHGLTIALDAPEGGWAVKLDFEGARLDARPEGRKKQEAVFSYFRGARSAWHVGLPTFSEVVYRELWPGVDLVFRGDVSRLKYEFVVKPGADPSRIRLRYRGASSVTVTGAGGLEIRTPGGSFNDSPPRAWQDFDGTQRAVDMAFAVRDGNEVAFRVGDYDRTRPLILDPAIFLYCGFIGAADEDKALGIAADAAGNAYVTGYTENPGSTFPVKVGPYLTYRKYKDAFVAKVNPTGTGLVYCGYISGDLNEWGEDIVVDGSGSAIVIGSTQSDENSFPVNTGPDLTHNGGILGYDVFVAKVNAKGTGLDYCGYVGGNSDDRGYGIALDAAGNAYLSGSSDSNETTFPVKIGPCQIRVGGRPAGFVAKLNADGKSLAYCGYIGGIGHDVIFDVSVDPWGCAYVIGQTESTEQSFPVKIGPDLTFNGGRYDAFVAKVNAKGTGLDYCGFIGGAGWDYGYGIAVDAKGHAYVVGDTGSTEKTFPTKVGPDLTYNGRYSDAYVGKLNALGTGFEYIGWIGGDQNDFGTGITVDSAGNAYVVGNTESGHASFPVKGGPDLLFYGLSDVFVAQVNPQGTGIVFCGYVGGSNVFNDRERGTGIALDGTGNVLVSGFTMASQNTFPVVAGPDLTHNGDIDGFVAKIARTLLDGNGTPRPGGTVDLRVTSTTDAGLAFVLGSSFGAGPIRIGSRTVALSVDKLLEVTIGNTLPTVFIGYQGVIGANGRAAAKINLPRISGMVGHRICTAFVTLGAGSPFGIRSISNTYSFTIVK